MVPIYASPDKIAELYCVGRTKAYQWIGQYEKEGGKSIREGRVHRIKVHSFNVWMESHYTNEGND